MNIKDTLASGAFLLRPRQLAIIALLVVTSLWLRYLCSNEFPIDDKMWSSLVNAEKLKLRQYIAVGMWLGGLVNVAACVALLATVRWWGRPQKDSPVDAKSSSFGKWGVIFLIATLVLAAWIRLPRLDFGYYGDEIYTLRKFVHGELKQKPLEEKRFKEVSWEQTVWGYKRPNNHILFTISARATLETWRAVTGADRSELPGAVLRFPAYVAGLISILALALLLRDVGLPVAGLVGALLMSVHPWHVFHSVTLRGYAFVFCFSLLAVWALVNACKTRKWQWWGAFVLFQTALLATYPAMVIPVALINVGILILLSVEKQGAQLWRWGVANTVSMCALSPLYLSAYPQLKYYLKHTAPQGGEMGPDWILDKFSCLFAGYPWHPWAEDHPLCINMQDVMQQSPVIASMAIGFAALFFLLGLWRVALGNRTLLVTIAAFIIAPVIGYVQAATSGTYLYLWYFVYVTPTVIILMSVGIDWLVSCAKCDGKVCAMRAAVVTCLLAVAFGGYKFCSVKKLGYVRNHAKEPTLEVHDFLRGREASEGSAVLVSVWKNIEIYNSDVQSIFTAKELDLMANHAQQLGKPLYVAVNYIPVHTQQKTDVWRAISDESRYEEVAYFPGLEHETSDCRVFRALPPNRLSSASLP